MGIRALRKILLGKEGTAGTAVETTTYWRGRGTLEDTREIVFPPEDVGYLSGLNRVYTPKLGGQIELEETEATFEQFPYLLSGGVLKCESGTVDGAGPGYIYEFNFPTTAANSISTFTVEGGDDAGAEEMEYGFVKEFSLSGVGGEALMMSGLVVGRQVAPTTFTATAELPTVEEILFSKGKLYIDAASGTLGGTLKSNTFLEMKLEVDTGWREQYTGEGNTYFSFVKNIGPEALLDLIFEHDAIAVAQKAVWRAETATQIRMIWTGSALSTASTYTVKTLIVDLAGSFEKFEKIDERDGNDIVTGRFRMRYDADAGASGFAGQIVVATSMAALP